MHQIAEAVEVKGDQSVSVCLPCRDEAASIGQLVSIIRGELMGDDGFVDELIVVDDRSTDDTGAVAANAGARVVSIDEIHAEHGPGHGKGNVLWASLLVSDGDVIVWCDGDVTSFEPDWVVGLAMPLLADPTSVIVKALYHRPTRYGGGGRTTELVARPMMSRWFPDLTAIAQPLAGEYSVRRSAIEQLEFVQGWGVEVALLIDIIERWGPEAIGQVDLGRRLHRHRELQSLSVQAAEVMDTILARSGKSGIRRPEDGPVLRRADGSAVPLNTATRPPVASLRNR
ncbi:MAG: glucosyl-3-phosphoglycerate synthase [Acidimicrobiales bacterium]